MLLLTLGLCTISTAGAQDEWGASDTWISSMTQNYLNFDQVSSYPQPNTHLVDQILQLYQNDYKPNHSPRPASQAFEAEMNRITQRDAWSNADSWQRSSYGKIKKLVIYFLETYLNICVYMF